MTVRTLSPRERMNLQRFALDVLCTLESHEEWGGDTLDLVAFSARSSGLVSPAADLFRVHRSYRSAAGLTRGNGVLLAESE